MARHHTTLSLSLLIAIGATGCDRPAAQAVARADTPSMVHLDQIGMENGRGLYVARRDAGESRIAFDVPGARVAPELRHDMEPVGETADGVVVLLDRYASRGSAGRCRDGREAFVRVFSLTARRELMSRPVESCLDGIAAGDPPVRWLEGDRFRVEGSAPATYAITGTERVTMVAGGGANG